MQSKTEGRAGMLFQVRRILFNCGSSKGRAKLLPKSDGLTKEAVLDSPDNLNSGWSKSNDKALRQGSRERLHEFA